MCIGRVSFGIATSQQQSWQYATDFQMNRLMRGDGIANRRLVQTFPVNIPMPPIAPYLLAPAHHAPLICALFFQKTIHGPPVFARLANEQETDHLTSLLLCTDTRAANRGLIPPILLACEFDDWVNNPGLLLLGDHILNIVAGRDRISVCGIFSISVHWSALMFVW